MACFVVFQTKCLKKGKAKTIYHKIMVKERPLREAINKYLKIDPLYIPINGGNSSLSYTDFFSNIHFHNL